MSLPVKEKPCDGIGKAHGFEGCGRLTKNRKHGLGIMCCYPDWLMTTEAGKIELAKAQLRGKRIVEKKVKAETKEAKEKLKKMSEYKAEAKKSFQKFIRLRDADQNCISCNTPTSDIWDGGHYKKAELYTGIIFNENNCHKQCRYCNRFLGGNEANYRNGLLTRIGEENLLELEKLALNSRQYKFTKVELIEIKKKYDLKIKEIINNL